MSRRALHQPQREPRAFEFFWTAFPHPRYPDAGTAVQHRSFAAQIWNMLPQGVDEQVMAGLTALSSGNQMAAAMFLMGFIPKLTAEEDAQILRDLHEATKITPEDLQALKQAAESPLLDVTQECIAGPLEGTCEAPNGTKTVSDRPWSARNDGFSQVNYASSAVRQGAASARHHSKSPENVHIPPRSKPVFQTLDGVSQSPRCKKPGAKARSPKQKAARKAVNARYYLKNAPKLKAKNGAHAKDLRAIEPAVTRRLHARIDRMAAPPGSVPGPRRHRTDHEWAVMAYDFLFLGQSGGGRPKPMTFKALAAKWGVAERTIRRHSDQEGGWPRMRRRLTLDLTLAAKQILGGKVGSDSAGAWRRVRAMLGFDPDVDWGAITPKKRTRKRGPHGKWNWDDRPPEVPPVTSYPWEKP